MSRKGVISLLLNICIIIMELMGLTIVFFVNNSGFEAFKFYTNDSNILLLISAILQVIYLISRGKAPKFVGYLKLVATHGVFTTIIIVTVLLSPLNVSINHASYFELFTKDSFLYLHTLCPILGVFTFLFYDEREKISLKEMNLAIIPTLIYTATVVTIVALGIITAPYDFLDVTNKEIYFSILYIGGVGLVIYFILFILRLIYNKLNKNYCENN